MPTKSLDNRFSFIELLLLRRGIRALRSLDETEEFSFSACSLTRPRPRLSMFCISRLSSTVCFIGEGISRERRLGGGLGGGGGGGIIIDDLALLSDSDR